MVYIANKIDTSTTMLGTRSQMETVLKRKFFILNKNTFIRLHVHQITFNRTTTKLYKIRKSLSHKHLLTFLICTIMYMLVCCWWFTRIVCCCFWSYLTQGQIYLSEVQRDYTAKSMGESGFFYTFFLRKLLFILLSKDMS